MSGPSVSRTGFDRRDLVAIAVGGVLGATLRGWITDVGTGGGYFTTVNESGGWFHYEPNTSAVVHPSVLPWKTLAVNLLGTLLLGAALTLRRGSRGTRRAWLALATGFCGSLTTFSSFAVELAQRFRHDPFPYGYRYSGDSQGLPFVQYGDLSPGASALLYIVVSVVGGAAAFWLGRSLARKGAQ